MVEEPMKEEGRAVFNLIVDEVHRLIPFVEMLNLADGIHGGCIAFLIDFCSSFALVALRTKMTGSTDVISVSQAINLWRPATDNQYHDDGWSQSIFR
ncbi:hypothetical protein MPER_08105 [Moniliophthora perniciosa FA553]|nr:hypothetical protein MPER_08105 [Moniliophthora perniciosa FA553]